MTQFIYSFKRNTTLDKVPHMFLTSPKASMNPEQLEPSSSPASALALGNIEEGMEHNAERAQELQEELGQRRASLHQDSVEAQAL